MKIRIPLPIPTVAGPVRGSIRPPGSKSITNRALVVAALADGRSRLTGVLDSDDTRVMIDGLRRLGVEVHQDFDNASVEIEGCRGRPPAESADLELENSGTSIRFLTTLCALGRGEFRLDGNKRMRERPIQDLVDAMQQWGLDVRCERDTGCPPVVVQATGLPGGSTSVSGNISSQYLSALLMVAPCAETPVDVGIVGELVSKPYVEMTLAVMRDFGVHIDADDPAFHIAPEVYRATNYEIEPDASAASYFFAAAALTGGEVTVEGISLSALQGDVGFVHILEQMGCTVKESAAGITVRGGELHGVDVDMNSVSDTAQTLACVAVFAEGPTRIRNIAHVRHKETDRITAVATELRLLGVRVEEHDDGLTIRPGPIKPGVVQVYDDHRMAMSFSLLGLKAEGVMIANPGCTAKTYPGYWDDMERLCGWNE